ncbi:hypothetical protein LTS16_005322 [Friedmanniomyces endolithicus]|nr:hypothetical protein LTR94_016756 [Friedmanniomyces endolithicus]KAK0775740.1 hypothetical protein LTR59_014425 [Friedmanniomyces endolithicus]KAK0780370.1 hypothetical protein LTR38_014094 [Friedmanniomyces endolithicus]KAK0806418.1 hypothetical protein LTR75_006957 [Friedmanniomyces endolithicus]KAK0847165.1 hypothetical protein LTR03_006512 [Friedmanniomyces endolithicus]
MDVLRARWNDLYKDRLPSLAKARDPVQKRWPVFLDHCFARIVLDNAVGRDSPWTEVVKAPAVKHMTIAQLEAAIQLAEKIVAGEADLAELNNRSLQLRGKKRKAAGNEEHTSPPTKKQRTTPTISAYFVPSPSSTPNVKPSVTETTAVEAVASAERTDLQTSMAAEIQRIADSSLTPFRKQTLTLLCEIPPGRYSTYQAMSDHITKTSHKTCARAVGNAMRNNPFAPEVPCHRILAADGSLGGFGGHWGENGKFAQKKHDLLHDEGLMFIITAERWEGAAACDPVTRSGDSLCAQDVVHYY